MNWGFSMWASGAAVAMVAERKPEIWHLLGYPFEAAGMIAALFGCCCARLWNGAQLQSRKKYRWSLDAPISALTFGTAIALVLALRPDPWAGLLYGTGVGVIGEGLFRFAEGWARRNGLLSGADATNPAGEGR